MEKGMNFFLNRYKQLGQNINPIEIKQSIRVNTLSAGESKLIMRLEGLGIKLKKIPFAKHGYWVEHSRFSLGAITEFLLGYYYIQEAAAQIPVEVLDPKQGELILDCCASPGGKTTQISQLMDNKGTVIALEKKAHRIESLKNNIERMNCQNTIVFNVDARKAGILNLEFDKVLLDAPCSGNFATEKDWFKKRALQGIEKSAEIQKSLIKSCMNVLKKNGVLVYSTCTLEPEENELNMQWLIDNFKVKLEKINIPIGDPGITNVFGKNLNPQIANCRRFWPNKTDTEGFFIAKVKKL